MAVVSLTKANNGQSIEVRQGDEIIVRLPENPTTGYGWHIDRADGLSPEMSEYAMGPDQPDPNPRFGQGRRSGVSIPGQGAGGAAIGTEALAGVGRRAIRHGAVRRRHRNPRLTHEGPLFRRNGRSDRGGRHTQARDDSQPGRGGPRSDRIGPALSPDLRRAARRDPQRPHGGRRAVALDARTGGRARRGAVDRAGGVRPALCRRIRRGPQRLRHLRRPRASFRCPARAPDRAPGASTPAPGRLLSRRGAILAATPMPIPTITRPRAFVPGIPGLEDFPFGLWRRLMAKQWRRAPVDRMLYGDPAGYRPLREAIAAYLGAARGVRCHADQIVVVGCSQQALDLAARLLVDEGDAVWIEDPGYPGARGAFIAAGARLIPVPVDDEGLDVGAGRGAREGRPPRLRHAVASVPAERDDEPDPATGPARARRSPRALGAGGRLRQRVPVQRAGRSPRCTASTAPGA